MTEAHCWHLSQKLPIRYQFTLKDYTIAGLGNITVRGKRKNTNTNGSPIVGDDMRFSMVDTGFIVRINDDVVEETPKPNKKKDPKTTQQWPTRPQSRFSPTRSVSRSSNASRANLGGQDRHGVSQSVPHLSKKEDLSLIMPHQIRKPLMSRSMGEYETEAQQSASASSTCYKLTLSSDSSADIQSTQNLAIKSSFPNRPHTSDAVRSRSPVGSKPLRFLRHDAKSSGQNHSNWQSMGATSRDGIRDVRGNLMPPPLMISCSGSNITLRSVTSTADMEEKENKDNKWARKTDATNKVNKPDNGKQLKRAQTANDLLKDANHISTGNGQVSSSIRNTNDQVMKQLQRSASVSKLKLNPDTEDTVSVISLSPITPKVNKEFSFYDAVKPNINPPSRSGRNISMSAAETSFGSFPASPTRRFQSRSGHSMPKDFAVGKRRDKKPIYTTGFNPTMISHKIPLHHRDSFYMRQMVDSMHVPKDISETKEERINDVVSADVIKVEPAPAPPTITPIEVKKPDDKPTPTNTVSNPLVAKSSAIHRLPSAKED